MPNFRAPQKAICGRGPITSLKPHWTRLGLAESTRVIYTTDHGDNLGARGLWNKCVMYRESTAVPMIVAGPDVTAGRVCNTTVNLIDVYPTIIESMGLDVAHDERDLPGECDHEI